MIVKFIQSIPMKSRIIAGFVTAVAVGAIAIQAQGSSEASEYVYSIPNQATISFCTEGDAASACDPANAKYTASAASNTVVASAVQTVADPAPAPAAPAPAPAAPAAVPAQTSSQPAAPAPSPSPEPVVKLSIVKKGKRDLVQATFASEQKGTDLYRIYNRRTTKLTFFRKLTRTYTDTASYKAGTYKYSLRRTDILKEKRRVKGKLRTYTKKVITVLGEATIKR